MELNGVRHIGLAPKGVRLSHTLTLTEMGVPHWSLRRSSAEVPPKSLTIVPPEVLSVAFEGQGILKSLSRRNSTLSLVSPLKSLSCPCLASAHATQSLLQRRCDAVTCLKTLLIGTYILIYSVYTGSVMSSDLFKMV